MAGGDRNALMNRYFYAILPNGVTEVNVKCSGLNIAGSLEGMWCTSFSSSFSSQTGVVSEQVNFVNMFCKDKRKQLIIFIRCLYWIVSWHSALASLFY